MNQELGFETIPFEITPEFQGEVFEEEGERGGRRPSAGGGSRYSRPRSRPELRPKGTKRPPIPRPRPIPRGPRRPWEVIRGPYGLVSAPYPAEPEPFGSERVRWVQDALNRILGLRLPVTGVMGPETRSAVRSFQKQKGLPVSGIVGPDTEKALLDARHPADAAAPPDEPAQDQGEVYEFETLELESPQSMPTLRRGSRGPAVADLQRRLAAAGFSPGTADGIFGSLTDAAVKSFQRSRGITADGIVGSQTWGQFYAQPGRGGTQPSSGTWGGSGSIRYGKGWGGSEGVADAAKAIAASMGVPVTSQKRNLADTLRVGSSTGSDHYTGNTTAFATDFGVSGSLAVGDQLAKAIATKYSIPQSAIGTFYRYTIQVGDRRYSLQLLWRVEGHYDHVHLGIRSA